MPSVPAVGPSIHSVAFDIPPPKLSATRRLAEFIDRYPDADYLAVGYPHLNYTSPPDLHLHLSKLLGNIHVIKAKLDGYGPTGGDPEIWKVLAEMLNADFPGSRFSPDRMLPVHGNTQAFSIFTELMMGAYPVKPAIIADERTYTGILALAHDKKLPVFAVELDDEGPVPESLEQAVNTARQSGHQVLYYYTVPDGHNPTGMTFSLERRKALVALAQKLEFYIFEDSAYSYLEFKPGKTLRLPPLAALDTSEHVLFSMSFSKVFGPGPRLAMMHVPFDWQTPTSLINVRNALLAKSGLQTLFSNQRSWRSLLVYLTDDDTHDNLWELSAERAAFYGTQHGILQEGLAHYFGEHPDVLTWREHVTHGFFTEAIYGKAPAQKDPADFTAPALMEHLVQKHNVLTLPMADFSPPVVQERDPQISRRLRLCTSYVANTVDNDKAHVAMAKTVNAFGQGVLAHYGRPVPPPFVPKIFQQPAMAHLRPQVAHL